MKNEKVRIIFNKKSYVTKNLFFSVSKFISYTDRPLFLFQVGAIPANAADDGQWSQGLISAVSPSRSGEVC